MFKAPGDNKVFQHAAFLKQMTPVSSATAVIFYAATRGLLCLLCRSAQSRPHSFLISHAAANPSRCCLRCESNLRGRCSADGGRGGEKMKWKWCMALCKTCSLGNQRKACSQNKRNDAGWGRGIKNNDAGKEQGGGGENVSEGFKFFSFSPKTMGLNLDGGCASH